MAKTFHLVSFTCHRRWPNTRHHSQISTVSVSWSATINNRKTQVATKLVLQITMDSKWKCTSIQWHRHHHIFPNHKYRTMGIGVFSSRNKGELIPSLCPRLSVQHLMGVLLGPHLEYFGSRPRIDIARYSFDATRIRWSDKAVEGIRSGDKS